MKDFNVLDVAEKLKNTNIDEIKEYLETFKKKHLKEVAKHLGLRLRSNDTIKDIIKTIFNYFRSIKHYKMIDQRDKDKTRQSIMGKENNNKMEGSNQKKYIELFQSVINELVEPYYIHIDYSNLESIFVVGANDKEEVEVQGVIKERPFQILMEECYKLICKDFDESLLLDDIFKLLELHLEDGDNQE